MDQLVLQWLSNRESNRHNVAVETETHRHNYATEHLERQRIMMTERVAAADRAAQSMNVRFQSSKAAEAQKYSADQNRASQREVSQRNATTQLLTTLMHESTARQANLINSRYNQGRLAIATSELSETRRANQARELENRQSRLQSNDLRMKELEYKYDSLEYQKSRDTADRTLKAKMHESEVYMHYSKQVVDLLGVGAQYKRAAAYGNLNKGGRSYGQTQTVQSQGSGNVIQGALEELERQGR